MLNAIVHFALTRRAIILLGLLVFLVGGVIALAKLNVEAYPNPAPVILEITAQAPGLSAEEMERYYTIPMEVGLAPTPGVEVIRSTSFYGLSFVRVTFHYGIDYHFARTQAAINLQQNVNLPNNVSPTIQGSSLVGEIFRYELVGPPRFGLTNLRTLQDWVMQRRLLTVPGVVQVVPWGGTTKAYEVNADLGKLDAYNVTLPQLITAVGNANINVGGRSINLGQQSVNIRGVGLIDNVADIENIVLSAQAGGVPILVKDVARASVGFVPRLGKAGRDEDDDVVTGIVVKLRTEPTTEVVERVRREFERINADGTLPAGVKAVPFYDRSNLVSITTRTVLHNVALGCLLVFFIQWLFLGDLRSAIIVATNIPFALFFSIILLVLTGESANLLSLGAVDFGIIVDSAVILVENVFRNFQAKEGTSRDWDERLRTIYLGATQVARPILFTTLITVAAFVPLFTMQGPEGQIFNPMARTYGYALAGALIATFTITPVLSSYLLPERVRHTETIAVRALRGLYQPTLRWVLENRNLTALIGVIFLAIGALIAPRLGTEFLPHLEEGNLWIRATLPPSISLEAGMPAVARLREIVRSHPEVISVVSQHGRPDDGSDAAGFFNLEFFAPLKPFDQWESGRTKAKLVEELQAEFAREFNGVTFNFSQYIQDNIEEALSGVKGANIIKILGRDLGTLEKLASQVLNEVKDVKGVADLGIYRLLGQPNLNITVDRDKAARYGLNAGDVNSVVQAALGGAQATMVREEERQFQLLVRIAPEYRRALDTVGNIKVGYSIPSGGNAYIRLNELARISLDTGASYIYRERNVRYVPIKFSVRGRDLGGTVDEMKERIAKNVALPTGYRIVWDGEFDDWEKAKERLAIIVPISLFLILVLLYALFASLRDSLLALAGIPFAVVGGILALWVTGIEFSVSSAIGFVSLFGVAVMDGILMITYYNDIRPNAKSSAEAMFEAASQRMRPMLMTAWSACIGLFPAAISTGIGSQVQRPLATVVVGGLLIGPIMLLVVVPALRMYFLKDDAPPQTGVHATGNPSTAQT